MLDLSWKKLYRCDLILLNKNGPHMVAIGNIGAIGNITVNLRLLTSFLQMTSACDFHLYTLLLTDYQVNYAKYVTNFKEVFEKMPWSAKFKIWYHKLMAPDCQCGQ